MIQYSWFNKGTKPFEAYVAVLVHGISSDSLNCLIEVYSASERLGSLTYSEKDKA